MISESLKSEQGYLQALNGSDNIALRRVPKWTDRRCKSAAGFLFSSVDGANGANAPQEKKPEIVSPINSKTVSQIQPRPLLQQDTAVFLPACNYSRQRTVYVLLL